MRGSQLPRTASGRTFRIPEGKTVWEQPLTPAAGAPTQYPWRLSGARTWDGATPPSPEAGAANYGGTSHGWADQHGAWLGGLMNGWYSAKGGPTTLGYLDHGRLRPDRRGAERFLRRFAGDPRAAGKDLVVEVSYEGGRARADPTGCAA